MSWMLRIEHRTAYRYRDEVLGSYNEARMTPLTTDRQTTVESRVGVDPRTRSYRYLDYWATVVDVFDIHVPHTTLTVTATSVVETTEAPHQPPDPGWELLTSEPVIDRYAEFLAPTAYAPAAPELVDLAVDLRDGWGPGATVDAVSRFVRSHLTYMSGVTEVSSSALEALHHEAGVCQDYAHLSIALLRAAGVPARYASGYLHTGKDGRPGDTVSGESHAWVEAWLGDWWAFDPTNGVAVGERHALVGRGRDYADVPPLKGVHSTGQPERLDVEVRITRLA
ncbi:MAG TPA: transglutaminase family protein [Acidimicrobiia bacterium]|nr:transglutaminase family protein [Acidimicrobiia bacterium]HTC80639.1 transglutaminase family protein [Acidimicrobiia bacterium]